MSAAEFKTHDNAIHNLISVNEQDWYTSMRTDWTQALGEASVAKIQAIIDEYFPNGRPASGAVQAVPYAESFEDGIGEWVQVQSDDYDWSIHSGYTETTNTGPSGASDGSQYLYAEGHDADGSYKTTAVECTFDLSSADEAMLSFDYHMYGGFITSLSVDLFDGTSWTSNVWIHVGAEQTSSESAWLTSEVDLAAYTGNNEVTVRFRAEKGEWHASDTAIDNIRIDVPAQSLPYAESFENGLGAWTQSTADDFDWSLNSGFTETTNTGPSGASDGSQYFYVENHDSGTQYKTAQVECRFDLSGVDSAELTFDYHMYGVYIDFLAVDVFDGTTWTSNVWNRTGQQQSSSEDPWLNASVDLSAYAGHDEVTIRFRSKQKQWHAADTAIDNIRVENPIDAAYTQWATVAFSNAPGGTDQTTSGNPDSDRYNNKQEWALILNPLLPDEPVLEQSISNSNFTVIYRRRMDSGVSVYASWANALTSTVWRVNGDGLTETSVGTEDDVDTMAAQVPVDDDHKFIRLDVE
jgi:hypothetical protein